ncbi:hypothetical protein FH039_10490 [Thermococcus indicus]|uniref:Transglutaminase-like domain-containing protein n=1 Tax=Thermococcus indicus TaxID=2586643 RepID=A0A4Y5SPB3_9EURY|nr:hypothetical protein [Thermococcus indicus]QDA31952.1 hypothetical protein FH039_10490 [Thermococcus indicus]
MGVYRAAAVPIIILFLTVSLVGHNTGRLREIPIVGEPWDGLTTGMINAVYETIGIYLGMVGTVDESVSSKLPFYSSDKYIARVHNSSYVYPYWSYTAFPREKLPEILKSKAVQDFVNSVITEAQSRLDGKDIPPDQFLPYLRGTAYEAMVERVKYCAGGPTKDPRYVVTRCGDCDDWHVVAYAIISKINEEHGINADYFLAVTLDHAFLVVYYPDEKKWEIYDWFPPIGYLDAKTSKGEVKEYIELNRWYCTQYLGVEKQKCVVKIRRFSKYSSLSAFYARNGAGGIRYLFEFPELRYVSPDDLLALDGNPIIKHLNP